MTKTQTLLTVGILVAILIGSALYINTQLDHLYKSSWRIGCVDGGGSVKECERLQHE